MANSKILVLNAGSSSVKYAVFDTATDEQLFKGGMERLKDVGEAIATIPALLKEHGHDDLMAVAHRVAHGGTHFRYPCLINDNVKDVIREYVRLAPQHNPPALRGIEVAETTWPTLPQVAVFDTAFHHTIPAYAYTYAVPKAWRDTGLRRYGFHGSSHKYVSLRTAQELGVAPSDLRVISCHLGNGASICAIQNGVSVDTSMGMTPLEGLMMGSRSGDVDPGLFQYLHDNLGLTIEEIGKTLHSESGLKAVSGVGNDMRDIEAEAAKGNKECQLALQMFAYRVHKYIGSYAAIMGGVDVITFTGGIGENSAAMRKRICSKLEYMGLHFDDDKNSAVHLNEYEAPQIHAENSRVRIMVTQSREAWMIFQESKQLLSNQFNYLNKHTSSIGPSVPIAVSAHHVHLTQEAVDALFGKGYQLTKFKDLRQPGHWASAETVDAIGPRGTVEKMRILCPLRSTNQVEVSRTEAFKLGLAAPIRPSGQLEGTPTVELKGPAGTFQTNGLIIAARHIHTNPEDAARMGVEDGEYVNVEVTGSERAMTFHHVIVRISQGALTEMHIDTDEANANGLENGGTGIVLKKATRAHETLHQAHAIVVPTLAPEDKKLRERRSPLGSLTALQKGGRAIKSRKVMLPKTLN